MKILCIAIALLTKISRSDGFVALLSQGTHIITKGRTWNSAALPFKRGDEEPENIDKGIQIAIVGGGIGGMTLALSLMEAGFHNIDIYESTNLSELGVGINIQPHAVRELIELGLGEELARTGIPTKEILYFHKNGQFIYGEPRGMGAGYRWPQYSIHRGKLLGLLYRSVQSRLGKERIHAGHKVINCGSSEEDGAWAQFQVRDGSDYPKLLTTIKADLIVGCDGVHSEVRKSLTNEGCPTWMGITMLRGLTRMKPFLGGRTMTIIGPIENEMVIYPISREAELEGESLVNWVALMKTNSEQNIAKEEWNVKVENIEEAMSPFLDFQYDFINVPDLIRNAESVYQYPMIDRPPLNTWVYGNVTLLGDAAHPMIPIGANGGTQAIIDGRVLALELARQPTLSAALEAYDITRRKTVNRIVRANREESETRFLEFIHQNAPEGFERLDDIITKEELDNISKTYKEVAGFDPKELNERDSYCLLDDDSFGMSQANLEPGIQCIQQNVTVHSRSFRTVEAEQM
eukprot:CAMPEP_0183777172 /NCGR_PEP_ID=MMETSP0739-20130205/48507_1 /TAXON_ID=385413 /ORGANISM="Thalassiosira miniscula, Strain CCMP1093" /LENGTH=518 /DNA_ID=CAMNT_0026019227 /DNA_START=1 /DNA_END=1557 /DNA_ORIENTATION=-